MDMEDNILKAFRKKKVFTLKTIVQLIDRSIPTARRRIKDWGILSSYNQNGRFYTLPEIAEFDEHGLWHWKEVSFSRYGTLNKTVVELVIQSKAGLDGREIGSLLRLNPRSFLSAFSSHEQLTRRKIKGRFVYFAADPNIFAEQLQRRDARSGRLPSAIEAVAILVEKVKHPFLDDQAISQRLRKQQVFVEPNVIENLFVHHGLAGKKTPPLNGSNV